MEIKKRDIKITIVIISLFVAGMVMQSVIERLNKNKIISDYGITVGIFHDFKEVGAEGNPYLTYKYNVDGIDYFRTIMPQKKLYYCRDGKCKGKMWKVLYYKKKPKRSLIDLSNEVTDSGATYVIENFEAFE
ncbi:hypothetical protein E9993_18810 [Labilibacter sediminis]|nr:hypothetical protein E9993_18810 [Labilibacter sediminis]